MKKHLSLIFLFSQFLIINTYSMESNTELSEQNIIMQEFPETVINIGKTNFVGEKELIDILPLDIWRVIARFLDFNDRALVYYFAPRVGLSKKQAVKIAIAFYNDLFKKIKKTKDFKTLLKLNENCFDCYRHENSKLLVKELIQAQNKRFLSTKNKYSQIHKNLGLLQKIQMRFSYPQNEIIEFWNEAMTLIVDNYSSKDNLNSLSDEVLFELSIFLSSLNKLYKSYRVSGIYMPPGAKVLTLCVSCFILVTLIGIYASGRLTPDINDGVKIAIFIFIGIVFGGSFVNSVFIVNQPCDETYLANFKNFWYSVKAEISRRKNIV